MPTSFDSFANGDVIQAHNVAEMHTPIQNLERGAAFYAGASAGTSTAYTATMTPAPDNPYQAGMMVNFKVHVQNTAGSPDVTLNVNGVGAKPIRKNGGVSLAAGDLKADQIVSVILDPAGTQTFQLISVSSVSALDYLATGLLTGSRADGNVTISGGTTTLTRDMSYDLLTLQTGAVLKTDGYIVRARKIVIQGSGRIENSGNNGGAVNVWDYAPGLNSHTLGGSSSGPGGTSAQGPGGNGWNGGSSAAVTRSAGGRGGTAGAGGSGPSGTSGGSPGTAGTLSIPYYCGSLCPESIQRGDTIVLGGSAGATAGSGAPDGVYEWSGGCTGGSGSAGGVMIVLCDELDVSTAQAGCIRARGGNASFGTNCWTSGNAGGAGGSGGGGGGYLHGYFGKVTGTLSNALDCDGGAGSAGTNAVGSGLGGTGGGGGSGGNIDVFRGDTNSWISVRGSAGSAGSSPSGTTGGAVGAAGSCKANL